MQRDVGKLTRPRAVGAGVGADVGRPERHTAGRRRATRGGRLRVGAVRGRQCQVYKRRQNGRRRGYRSRGGTRARRRREKREHDSRRAPRRPVTTTTPPRRVERTHRPHYHRDVTSTTADDAARKAIRELRVVIHHVLRVDRLRALVGRAPARARADASLLAPRAKFAAAGRRYAPRHD